MSVGKVAKRTLARQNAEEAKLKKKQSRDAKKVAPSQKKQVAKRK